MNGEIKILDCTLRDGGQCLEDIEMNGIHIQLFQEEERMKIASSLRDSKIEIIELGCIEESKQNKEGFAIYQSVQELSRLIPIRKDKKQMFVGLYTGPDTDIGKIPNHSPGLVDGIRVILRYSELEKSLTYCRELAKKGYKVFVQPMLTMRYSDYELMKVIDAANEMGAYALYFVDSFGYMNVKDIERLFEFYAKRLNSNIFIGFHAHNNMNRAFENVKYFIDHFTERKKLVDSCVYGMGQGAGNLQTEILVHYMNEHHGTEYQFNNILEICDLLEKYKPYEMATWGYSPVRMIPAIHKAAYKYASAMKWRHGMSLVEIHKVLSCMPEAWKHRYTAENLDKLLKDQ